MSITASLLLATCLLQSGQNPPDDRRPPRTGRITLPDDPAPKPAAAEQRALPDIERFHRDVIDLRRSKTLTATDEERLLRGLRADYEDPAGLAVRLALQAGDDLIHGLMKVVDRYAAPEHVRELHFLLLSRPLGTATERVVRTIVRKDPGEAKSRLLDYLVARHAPLRKAAVEMLPDFLAADDTPRLLELSRDKKSDVRAKAVLLLGRVDDARARERLLQVLESDPEIASNACEALLAQGEPAVPLLQQIVRRPARGRAYGYATYALVKIRHATGVEAIEPEMLPGLRESLRGDNRMLRVTGAIALGDIAYRGAAAAADPLEDRQIVEGLLQVVAPTEFVSSPQMLKPLALDVLVRFTGRDFRSASRDWRSWWLEVREDFVGLRREIQVTEANAGKAVLRWLAGDVELTFRGIDARAPEGPEPGVAYILSAQQMAAAVERLRGLGFMAPHELPIANDLWTVDLRVDTGRVAMQVLPSTEDGTGARMHGMFVELARGETWQKYRDPESQPDAAAFWRAERRWREAHPGEGDQRTVQTIVQRLPRLAAPARQAALADLLAIPRLPERIREEDALVLVDVARKLPQIGKDDYPLLEIALLAPGELMWTRVLGILEGDAAAAGGPLATHLFRLLGVERVVLAIRHPSKAIALAAMHDAANNDLQPAIAALLARIDDPDADVQRTAIFALGMLHAAGAREPLLAREPKAHPVIRREIWVALGRIGGAGVAQTLIRAMENPGLEEKLAALTAMGYLEDEETTRFLAAHFVGSAAQTDAFVNRAEMSLRQVGALHAIPALRPHLQMADGPARRRLVLLLGEFSDSRVVRDLIDVLRDPENEIVAARFLSEITGVDLRKVNDRVPAMLSWYGANRNKPPGAWFLDVLAAERIQTKLVAGSLTPRSGVAAVDELARLLVAIEEPHLLVMTGMLLRETTGKDFIRNLRHADPDGRRGIADRYRFHAAAVQAAKKD